MKRMNITRLEVKWTVSKGQDTYGYNICSLWTNGVKVASCLGGGYDMLGTCLGQYLEIAYQKELDAWILAHSEELVPYASNSLQHPDYYGMHYTASGRISLDGGCGYEAMRKIAEDILSLEHEYSINKRGNITAIYLAQITE